MTYETIMGIIIINNNYYVNICHIRNIHQHNIWIFFSNINHRKTWGLVGIRWPTPA